jgi:hypothetical protein
VKLTDEQKDTVAKWADEDEISLGDIQKRLKSEFEITVTFLETRFLLEDHGIELKVEAKPEPKPEAAEYPPDELDEVEAILDDDYNEEPGGRLGDDPAPGAGSGKVSVKVASEARPNAMVSGMVTFSDGVDAAWSIDQMGRLSLDSSTPEHRPSEADIMAFQQELQSLMGRM